MSSATIYAYDQRKKIVKLDEPENLHFHLILYKILKYSQAEVSPVKMQNDVVINYSINNYSRFISFVMARTDVMRYTVKLIYVSHSIMWECEQKFRTYVRRKEIIWREFIWRAWDRNLKMFLIVESFNIIIVKRRIGWIQINIKS